jgi:tetratricopeptide (TPR) repeat protein
MSQSETPSFEDRCDHARSIHRAGRVAEAEAIYEELLREDPGCADVIGLLAVAASQAGDIERAKALWWRSLSCEAPAWVVLRDANNLMATLRRGDDREGMATLADRPLPEWPAGRAPDTSERNAVLSLAESLSDLGRKEEALRLLKSILPMVPGDREVVAAVAALMLAANAAAETYRLLDGLDDATKRDRQISLLRAAAASAAGDGDAARQAARDFAEAVPVYLTERVTTQDMLVGVLNPAPRRVDKPTTPMRIHFHGNTPALLAEYFSDRYRFLSIFPDVASAREALRDLPRPDLVINNCVNAETLSTPGTRENVARFANDLGVPILNHPDRASEVTRQRNAERLAGIPDTIVPRVMRFMRDSTKTNELVVYIGGVFGYPVLIRKPFEQKGKALWRAESPPNLREILEAVGEQQFYAIQYVDNPTEFGVYRKLRAMVVGQEIFPLHALFSKGWCVHRTVDDKRREPDALDRAIRDYSARFAVDPAGTVGAAALRALGEIRARIPLDLFGIDFDITPDGKVLFFEANASMAILPPRGRSRYEDDLRMAAMAAIDTLFRAAVAGPSGAVRST